LNGGLSTPRWRDVWLALGVGLAVVGAAHLGDRWACEHVLNTSFRSRDWYQQLRQLGSVVPWLVLSLGLFLARRPGAPYSGLCLRLTLSVLVGGAAAEVLKLAFGRLRPEDAAPSFDYAFWPWAERIHKWSDCGIPSSHTGVAFGGAMALTLYNWRLGLLLFPLACGTGWTRVVNGNHYLSDVTAGAVVGVVSALVVARLVAGSGKAGATLGGRNP
jgi:membrane-associated phospholipid phosphatase